MTASDSGESTESDTPKYEFSDHTHAFRYLLELEREGGRQTLAYSISDYDKVRTGQWARAMSDDVISLATSLSPTYTCIAMRLFEQVYNLEPAPLQFLLRGAGTRLEKYWHRCDRALTRPDAAADDNSNNDPALSDERYIRVGKALEVIAAAYCRGILRLEDIVHPDEKYRYSDRVTPDAVKHQYPCREYTIADLLNWSSSIVGEFYGPEI
jgi:hypothetical protein